MSKLRKKEGSTEKMQKKIEQLTTKFANNSGYVELLQSELQRLNSNKSIDEKLKNYINTSSFSTPYEEKEFKVLSLLTQQEIEVDKLETLIDYTNLEAPEFKLTQIIGDYYDGIE